MKEINEIALQWDPKLLPSLPFGNEVIRDPNSQETEGMFSQWNKQGNRNQLSAYFARAAVAIHSRELAETCVVEINEGGKAYAAEHTCQNGDTIIFYVNDKGVFRGCRIDSASETFSSINVKSSSTDDFTPMFACCILLLSNPNFTQDPNISNTCRESLETIMAWEDLADSKAELFYLNDVIYTGFRTRRFKGGSNNWKIDPLLEKQIQSLSGNVICGTPNYLNRGIRSHGKVLSFGSVKAEFAAFAAGKKWSPEEEKYIPSFDDNYPVVPEVVKIAKMYSKSRNAKRPFNNFLWRGVTAYGKSTGVELIAALLHMPLLRVTCKSTMDTEDFKAQFVPDNDGNTVPSGTEIPELRVVEMIGDPASAFEKLTGEYREDISTEEVLQEYIRLKSAAALNAKTTDRNSMPRFKMVQPNYVKALSKGYILEIQEMSRIKDPGVLVGLNEYDRANAIIELPDGHHVRRHKDTMVIWTDNVGYTSCRAVDPSVMRRMDLVLDSFELTDEQMIARVKYNTGYEDDARLKHMLKVLREVIAYCKENDMRDGDISVNELERWVQYLQIEGDEYYEDGCYECVVSKVSPDREVQESLQSYLSSGILAENVG